MRPRIDPSPSLTALAALQSGVVSREQALADGLTDRVILRLTRLGHWQAVCRGIYLTGTGPIGWLSQVWAGVLLGGDAARAGGLTAARLHGLYDDDPDQILILTPRQTRHRNRPPWVFRRENPGVRQRRSPGSPPRTTVEDTVLDLCDPRLDWADESPTHWVTRAVQRRLTTTRRLLTAAEARPQLPQRRLLRELLGDVGDGAETVLELRYLRDVERAHGLPRGHRQASRRAHPIEGTQRAHRDILYRDYGLVVELDGRLGHVAEGRLHDLRRDNITTLRGERTLRYGWLDVTDEPCWTARQVAEGLRQGGWTGLPTTCPRCARLPDDGVLG